MIEKARSPSHCKLNNQTMAERDWQRIRIRNSETRSWSVGPSLSLRRASRTFTSSRIPRQQRSQRLVSRDIFHDGKLSDILAVRRQAVLRGGDRLQVLAVPGDGNVSV